MLFNSITYDPNAWFSEFCSSLLPVFQQFFSWYFALHIPASIKMIEECFQVLLFVPWRKMFVHFTKRILFKRKFLHIVLCNINQRQTSHISSLFKLILFVFAWSCFDIEKVLIENSESLWEFTPNVGRDWEFFWKLNVDHYQKQSAGNN